MIERVLVRRGAWYDSAFLMRVSRRLGELDGVMEAVVMMGTEMNRRLLEDAGFAGQLLAAATAMDMVVALRVAAEARVEAVEAELERLLEGGAAAARGARAEERPRTVEEAVAARPAASLVSVAVPGVYAAFVARRALAAGRHVFLFSDNVSVEDEVDLKRRAREAGLLVMGPDCGTSILSGVGLGFSNRVVRGPIGLAGPSGTGIQELCCLLAAQGQGISHAIGTGGRDLSRPVGGVMTELAVRLLCADSATRVVVVVAKQPDPEVAERLHAVLAAGGKPAVVRFLGQPPRPARDGVHYAATLDEAADVAAARARGDERPAMMFSTPPAAPAEHERAPIHGRLLGLFSGGSLAAEAREILRRHGVNARVPDPPPQPGQPLPADDNLVIDVGGDVYTRGRPHPMVDQGVRLGLLAAAGRDRSVGVVLLDLVLGDGAHPDPAPEWVPVLAAMRRERGAGAPLVVVSLCGTAADPQGLSRQRAALEGAGVWVHTSAARAVAAAARLITGGGAA